MAGRGHPGVEAQHDKRHQYMTLIKDGVNQSEAARIVGINRRTGTRWLYGRTVITSRGDALHYAPVSPASSPPSPTSTAPTVASSPRFLDADERIRIADLHRRGLSRRTIAADLGRSHSSISRELRRNSDPADPADPADVTGVTYGASRAQHLATARRRRPRPTRLEADTELREHVQARLEERWSPEQIAHDLREHFPDQPRRHLVAETLYQGFYARFPVLTRNQDTRRWRRYRRPRSGRVQRRRAVPLPLIETRPASVTDRVEPGHWEGDLIMGLGNRSAIATLVERTTRAVMLVHLPAGKGATAVTDGLLAAFSGLPAPLRRTLTWDQGTEMADYRRLVQTLGLGVYFAHPHSPWERASNENTNRLLRDYFPKHTDLAVHSADRLAAVAAQLNDRPRRTLGWATPAALFAEHLHASPLTTTATSGPSLSLAAAGTFVLPSTPPIVVRR